MNKLAVLLALALVALAAAGCGGSSSSSGGSTSATTPKTTGNAAATHGVRISSATVAGLGPALVNAKGRTLYVFVPDKDKKVTCTGSCAAVWPPAFLPQGQKAVASAQVKRSLLGSDPDPAGGRVITYAGWPLYTYVSDAAAGQAAGQAVNLNGGLWYVISPDGKLITKKP